MQGRNFFPQDEAGNLLTDGLVSVRDSVTQALVLVYASDDVNDPLGNPFPIPEDGQVTIFAPDGDYDITYASGDSERTLPKERFMSGGTNGGTAAFPIAVFQFRRDTAANWESVNPILADGEPGLETDSMPRRLKVGDGVTPWNDLEYLTTAGGGSGGSAPENALVSDENVTGSPVSAWEATLGAILLVQSDGAKRPTIVASAFGSTQGLLFDGSNDNLSQAGYALTATEEGTLSVVFKTPATVTAGVILSQSDVAAANKYWELGIDSNGKLYVEANQSGTILRIVGSTALEGSTVYHAMLFYDGTDFYLLLQNVEENPLVIETVGPFAWLGAITGGTPAFTVGATLTSGGTMRPLNFTVGAIYAWSTDLSEAA